MRGEFGLLFVAPRPSIERRRGDGFWLAFRRARVRLVFRRRNVTDRFT
jgi:hypothetical protein